jgi:hypothetical protein
MSRPAWGHVTRHCIYCGGVGPRTQVVGGYAHKRCLPTEDKPRHYDGPSTGRQAKRNNYPRGIEKMDDYLERRVKLVKELQTRGGTVFKQGEVMKVDSHHRGRLRLSNARGAISKVDRRDVELIFTK